MAQAFSYNMQCRVSVPPIRGEQQALLLFRTLDAVLNEGRVLPFCKSCGCTKAGGGKDMGCLAARPPCGRAAVTCIPATQAALFETASQQNVQLPCIMCVTFWVICKWNVAVPALANAFCYLC